jgi:membrane-associated HD superfamily phosphohydrolase
MKGRQKDNYAKRKSEVLATAVVAPILTLFICSIIVSFKFIKKAQKRSVVYQKVLLIILLSHDIEILFCYNAMASSTLTESITPNTDSR